MSSKGVRKKASQIRLLFWATCCFFIINNVILILLFNSLKYTPIHIYTHRRGIILWFLHIRRAVSTPLIFLMITFPIFAVLNTYQMAHPSPSAPPPHSISGFSEIWKGLFLFRKYFGSDSMDNSKISCCSAVMWDP